MLESKRLYQILLFFVGLFVVLLINQVAGILKIRWDLTEEKRYTLHSSTKNVLTGLTEPVNIEVFLDGELPSNFQRFKIAIRETLEQFGYYAGSNIQFKFSDPSVANSAQARNEYYKTLIDKGIEPSNVTYTKNGQKTEKLIFPGAILNYQGRELSVSLLKGKRATSVEEMLNQSIEGIEYELSNAISLLQSSSRKRIGFIVGVGEPDSSMLAGFTNIILSKYDLYRINLPERRTPLVGYDVIIIGKPSREFKEREKYLLDQYVMKGGNLVIFQDMLSVDMSQAEGEGTIAVPYELNLEDLYFKYGIRLNKNYVADVNCGFFPVYTGSVGDQPRIEMLSWPYFPVITNYANHPMVRNLDATWFRGASTIDTVKADGIKKTPLLFTSQYTRVFSPPVRVSFNDMKDKLVPEVFTSGVHPLAYLLEGKFSSLYKNRFLPPGTDQSQFIDQGTEAKIIVVADGDFIRNDFNVENGNPLPMGMDAYTQTNYANEMFLLNSLDYMLDEQGLMLARNKQVKIRPLDKVKVQNDGDYWKWLNMGGPLLILILFAILKGIFRKKMFAK